MPYPSSDDLPQSVRKHLPPRARGVYREAFNHAWETYRRDPDREQIAHRVAWSAVKKLFRKAGDLWVAKLPGPVR